jgi:hypothetical protein
MHAWSASTDGLLPPHRPTSNDRATTSDERTQVLDSIFFRLYFPAYCIIALVEPCKSYCRPALRLIYSTVTGTTAPAAVSDRRERFGEHSLNSTTQLSSSVEMAPPIPCPSHPTFSVERCIAAALEEDAGMLGDVTTLATCALPAPEHWFTAAAYDCLLVQYTGGDAGHCDAARQGLPKRCVLFCTFSRSSLPTRFKADGVLAGQALCDCILRQVDAQMQASNASHASTARLTAVRRLLGQSSTARD